MSINIAAVPGSHRALASLNHEPLPVLIATADERADIRFLELFASTIRNSHTRRAYARAVSNFLT